VTPTPLAAAAQRGALWKVAVLAFVAMCLNDVFGTIMVVEESRLNAVSAGVFDVLGWVTGLVCAALALDSIIRDGWRTRRSLVIIASVSVANFLGTLLGVHISTLLAHH